MTEPAAHPAGEEVTRWEALSVDEVAARLRRLAVPWLVAGGWALDLYLGRQTRAHDDIEVAVFRDDVPALRAALSGWDVAIADRGTLTEWHEDAPLPAGAHELYWRERGRDAWQLEVLVEERRGDRWVYRRDDRIGLRAADLGRRTDAGIPYVRPDVQLLYKSTDARAKGESDFLMVLPSLDPAARGFLAAALWTTAPGHRWLERLK